MESLIKRTITVLMVILMSFSVIAYVGNSDFTVSAASAKTISIKKKPTVKASNIKATTVKLKWSTTKNATSYRIYKSTNKKKWTLVAKTKKTSYTVKNLKGNKKYYFKVRAYNSNNKKTKTSPYSKVITVKTKKNEKVYATKNVKIRAKASTKSKVLGTLKKGKSITRTATGDNGWSKVLLDGKTAYVASSYLTTKKPVEETTTKKQETTTEKREETTTKKPVETTKKETTTKKSENVPTQTSGGIKLKPITSSTAKKIVNSSVAMSGEKNVYEGKSADGKTVVVYVKFSSGWLGEDSKGAFYDASGKEMLCEYCGSRRGNGTNLCNGDCVVSLR